ncbi:hypothetical protein C8J57DRAFT_1237268 [Mycena rebaudengoi]|nr:hypothetical protein C8J57DRAFT_1237268 [Mycena rebaudengoi]
MAGRAPLEWYYILSDGLCLSLVHSRHLYAVFSLLFNETLTVRLFTFSVHNQTPQIFQLHARVVLDNEFIKRDSDIRAVFQRVFSVGRARSSITAPPHPHWLFFASPIFHATIVSPGRIARSRWLRRGGVAGSRILRQRFWRLKNLRLGAAEFARPAAGSSKRGRGVGKGLLLADWYLNTGSAASGALLLAIAVLQTRGTSTRGAFHQRRRKRASTEASWAAPPPAPKPMPSAGFARTRDARAWHRRELSGGRRGTRFLSCTRAGIRRRVIRRGDTTYVVTGVFRCEVDAGRIGQGGARMSLRGLWIRPLRHGKNSTTTTTAAPAVRSVAASERATATPPQPRPIHIPYTMMQRSVLVPLRWTAPPRGFFYFKPACTARALAGRARIPLPRSIICDASSLAPLVSSLLLSFFIPSLPFPFPLIRLRLATRALRQSGARTLRSRRARSAELCFVSARLPAQWAARALRRKTSRMHAHARETQTGRTGAARSRFAPNHGLARAWRARCSGSQGRRILAARGSAAAGTCSRLRGQRVRTQAPPACLRRVWSRRGTGCEAASRTSNLAMARLVEPQTRKARDLAIASMSCISARALLACPVSSRNCGAACSHTRDHKPGWRARVHPACAVRRRRYPHLESGALSALPTSNRRAESLAGSCGQRGCALKCSRIIPVSAARCVCVSLARAHTHADFVASASGGLCWESLLRAHGKRSVSMNETLYLSSVRVRSELLYLKKRRG